MKSVYIQVAEKEEDEPVEVPIEDDECLEVETLVAQFPGACGLKYRSSETKLFRGLKVVQGKIQPPDDSWCDNIYVVVFAKGEKRKGDDSNGTSKHKRQSRCTDLIALGLPYKSTDDDVREYFSKFGELVMVEVKKDGSGNSKGFGFIRFSDYGAQRKCLSERHMLDGRWFDVKLPNAKDGDGKLLNNKVFIGRMSEDITTDDLKDFFSEHGEVIDAFIPKPFKGIAFVTFSDPYDAEAICDEHFIIKSTSVHCVMATPRPQDNPKNGPYRSDRGDRGGYRNGQNMKNDSFGDNDDNSQFNPAMMAAFGQALMSTMSSMNSASRDDHGKSDKKPKASYRHF